MKSAKLTSYLAAGVTAVATGQADAATIVTLYGPGAQNPSSPGFDPPVPAGIDIDITYTGPVGFMDVDSSDSSDSYFAYDITSGFYFTRGENLTISSSYSYGNYGASLSFLYGAIAGAENYANISFDGNDGVYEAVGQFFFDGAGGGYLIALAVDGEGNALSISDGKAAIDAVPEPTTVGLLALGAAGLTMLRRKRKATPSSQA